MKDAYEKTAVCSTRRYGPALRAAWAVAILGVPVFVQPACRGPAKTQTPNLAALYSRAARQDDPHRNPVILIPGILGSRLKDRKTRTVVWGAFGGGYADPSTPAGTRLLALPMRPDVPLHRLRDDVRPDGVLARIKVTLLGIPIRLRAYVYILRALGIGGFRDSSLGRSGAVDYGKRHFTCFQFGYDWRRDNVENAGRLHRFILEKKRYVRREIKRRFGVDRPDIKFDIVAHSMGALLTRYYLRYGDADLPADGSMPKVTWAGARHVERAILVGPPNAGSVRALVQLVRGKLFSTLLPRYPATLLGTLPSIYQLLPRPRHQAVIASATKRSLNVYDPALWERMGWGLAARTEERALKYLLPHVADPGQRRRIALDHLRKCLARALKFARALDRPAEPPRGLNLYLMAGDAFHTPSVAAVHTGTGRVKVIRWASGDGTVLRSSALMDERIGGKWRRQLVSPIRWRGVQFLFSGHRQMTRDPAFVDNLLYLLLEDPRRPAPGPGPGPARRSSTTKPPAGGPPSR